MEKCPWCGQEFEDMPTVHVRNMEPFTAIAPMEGLAAWGVYAENKEVIHQKDGIVHWRWGEQDRLTEMVEFDGNRLAIMREYWEGHPQPCSHESCEHEGMACYLNTLDDTPHEWYCEEHAHEHGYCALCGFFNAGFESFDFDPDGWCESCREEIEMEFEDYDDDDLDFGWHDEFGSPG